MDRVFHYSLEKSGDKQKTKQFNLTIGMNSSALEHSVPEQLFSTTANPAEAVSAVKALSIANSQGIPIYQVNQQNIATILPNLQLDAGTISDIQNAVNAGKEVTVQQREIDFQGRMVAGYLIIDPETGAGAYMISGGSNGAYILLLWASIMLIGVIIALSAATLLTPAGALFISVFSSLLLSIIGTIGNMIIATNLGGQTSVDPLYVLKQITNIIAQNTLGAGLTSLLIGAGGVPMGVLLFYTAIIIGAMIAIDYVINFLTTGCLFREEVLRV